MGRDGTISVKHSVKRYINCIHLSKHMNLPLFSIGDDLLTDSNLSQQSDMGGVVSNAFGEHSLFGVNRNAFQGTDASTVFRNHFGESLFKEKTFYIIVGTDSGLLYQYIKAQGVPKGSHYLFVELPQVLALLHDMNDPEAGFSIANEENWQERANEIDILDYAIQERLVLHRSLGVIHGHCGSYSPLWRHVQKKFDAFMDKQRVALNSQPFTARQIENFSENQVPAICLKGIFRGKTAVVLAGGPSLDELLPWVQQNRQNLLVIAVSRVSYALFQANIQPDIVVSVDPYPINLNVSKEMLEFHDGTLLVNEFHLSSNLLASWGGKKVYMGKRYPWKTSLEADNFPPTVGNTVTNTAFTIAVETGVEQLILGGVDFCYSQEGYTHASGSAEHSLGSRPMFGNQRTMTNSGIEADTDNTFVSSAKTINHQAQLASAQRCLTINPAPGAMRLPNVEHIPLEIIEIEPLEKPAQEIIAATLASIESIPNVSIYKNDLIEVERVKNELDDIKKLSKEALKYNQKLFSLREKGAKSHNNQKLSRIEAQLDQKYADSLTFIKYFGMRRLIPILHLNEHQKDDVEENTRLYFQALIDTIEELLTILQRSKARIHCRLEEEKPEPDIQCLLDQWIEDHQPGRAIQWAQNHVDVVQKLPQTVQQEIHDMKDRFDESVEALHQIYLKGIEKGLNLDGLSARANEFFKCQDKDGLLRLLTGLNIHRDPTQANAFIPLVEGYLAELDHDPQAAIPIYQTIKEGPVQIDALMRLFELHTKEEDLPSSVVVLSTLSQLSTTYSPMYADLLQATGEIDTAIDVYTDYILANPEDLNTMMKLGKLYEKCDSSEGVTMTMNYILDKDPDNQTAKTMLASLNQQQVNGE